MDRKELDEPKSVKPPSEEDVSKVRGAIVRFGDTIVFISDEGGMYFDGLFSEEDWKVLVEDGLVKPRGDS